MIADIIDETRDWEVGIPFQALASGSIVFRSKNEQSSTTELFKLIQKVAAFWEREGIENYLIYTSSQEHGWEMVPYFGNVASLWSKVHAFVRQVLVVTRVIFGRASCSTDTKYRDIRSAEALDGASKVTAAAHDAFCNPKRIEAQQVWEGKTIRVLYDYAPLGPDKLHFLLTTKEHKERFTELSQEEFNEVQEWAEKLAQAHPNYICYRYNKTGRLAGQTVPHFHEHVIFVKPQDDFWGKLSVLYRMIIPATPIPDDQLKVKMEDLKKKII